ncbi:hypothetical protein JCM33774_45280 [Actinophytocola sp. KF-1]
MADREPQAACRKYFLAVISDAHSLAWVLDNKRMAFPEKRRRQLEGIREGDGLFIYTARGCFGNPDRDRSRVIGMATIENAPTLSDPITLGFRSFSYTCRLSIDRVAPLRTGVGFSELVEQLESFPDKIHWSARLRTPPVELTARDSQVILDLLGPIMEPISAHLSSYIAAGAQELERRAGGDVG